MATIATNTTTKTTANSHQQLKALTDKLRLEIQTLRDALQLEKHAVRELKAQNDKAVRRHKVDLREREQQFKQQLRRGSQADVTVNATVACDNCRKLTVLTNENTALKQMNKDVEERLHNVLEADRLKAADLRTQHDTHLIEVQRLQRSTRHETQRLISNDIDVNRKSIEHSDTTMPPALKERLVGHLIEDVDTNIKQQTTTFTLNNHKHYIKDERIGNDPQLQTNKHRKELYYRPLVDVDRAATNSSIVHQCIVEEDTDSAVSSAPSSLSPQPYHHTPPPLSALYHHQYHCDDNVGNTPPASLSPQPSDDDSTTSTIDLWYRSADAAMKCVAPGGPGDDACGSVAVQTTAAQNGELQTELAIAKCQVRELERALLVTREVKLNNQSNTTKTYDALQERIRWLEAREATLLRELQELRDQNELQEFRILELEEYHEKWSLRSQSSSELRDLPTNEYKGDVVREHLLVMIARKCVDAEDKHCLQQVLTLLDNLEMLSQEHSEHSTCCLDDTNDYYSLGVTSTARNEENNNQIHFNKSAVPAERRMVATVLPFIDTTTTTCNSISRVDTDDDDFSKHLLMKKKQLSNASSLQESGIFEGDNDTTSVETQTDSFIIAENQTNKHDLSELTAEIQKLNKIRASLEENGKKSVSSICKELEYYKKRLEILENKIIVYESSGDLQMKKLKERLNHELMLTSQVNELQQKVHKLEKDNHHLEEEKCEFEEAENDTRLQYQQLEMELRVTTEYLRDVEEARSASKRKAKEAKASAAYWESMFARCEARNYELEERETDLQCRLDSMEALIPILILYNLWRYLQPPQCTLTTCTTYRRWDDLQNEKTADLLRTIKHLEEKLRRSPPTQRLSELTEANKELRKQIDLHKHREDAYIETLQQADNIWAEMESGYKKRIQVAEDNELQLRTQVRQLEENDAKLRKNIVALNERIIELEDSERRLEERTKCNDKEQKYLQKENSHLKEELNNAKNEWRNMKDNVEGSLHVEMDRLRKKIRALQEEIDVAAKVLEDAEESHQKEVSIIKMQLQKTNKELVHLDITNSELREEITQLETRVSELQTGLLEQRINADRTIKNLSSELAQRDKQCLFRKRSFNALENSMTLSLRDELQKSESST